MVYLEAIDEIEPDKSNIPEQLEDIKEAIKLLANTALDLIPEGISKERAEAYWYNQIVCALDDDHSYFVSNACQMITTINELDGSE